MAASNEEVSQSQGNEWPVAAMVPLSDRDVTAGRALTLSFAELRKLLDTDGKLVVLLLDLESYAEDERHSERCPGSLFQGRPPGRVVRLILTQGLSSLALLSILAFCTVVTLPFLHVDPPCACLGSRGLCPLA